jgi:MoaD family protein
MTVSVKIPTQLRTATDGEATATVDGATVGEVLDSLYERYGELRSRIAEDGGLRRFVNVYVGGEDIRFLDGLETEVSDGDEVTILPAVAGGRARDRGLSRPVAQLVRYLSYSCSTGRCTSALSCAPSSISAPSDACGTAKHEAEPETIWGVDRPVRRAGSSRPAVRSGRGTSVRH